MGYQKDVYEKLYEFFEYGTPHCKNVLFDHVSALVFQFFLLSLHS